MKYGLAGGVCLDCCWLRLDVVRKGGGLRAGYLAARRRFESCKGEGDIWPSGWERTWGRVYVWMDGWMDVTMRWGVRASRMLYLCISKDG